MEGILDLLNSDLGKSIISGVSRETGTNQQQTSNTLSMALPVLMKAMERNTASPQGAKDLMSALNSKHDGSILNNLDSFFGGGVNEEAKIDGGKILTHVLGTKQQGVEQVIGEKAGLNTSAVANILKVAAPILMGVLGKQAQENNLSSQGDLGGLLGGMLGNNTTNSQMSFLEQVLDSDGDGSVVDDVSDMLLNTNNKGGIGGMLGKLFS